MKILIPLLITMLIISGTKPTSAKAITIAQLERMLDVTTQRNNQPKQQEKTKQLKKMLSPTDLITALDKVIYTLENLLDKKKIKTDTQDIDTIANINPIKSARDYLTTKNYDLYNANTVFNALLKIIYYEKTSSSNTLYYQNYKSNLDQLSFVTPDALVQIKKFDKDFSPEADIDSNEFEKELTKILKNQQKWTRSYIISMMPRIK